MASTPSLNWRERQTSQGEGISESLLQLMVTHELQPVHKGDVVGMLPNMRGRKSLKLR